LHQLVFHPAIPSSILKSLIGEKSLLKEVLNSRDFEGKTPVMLAIQHENFAFLDAISESKSIFIKDDQYLSQALSKAFASQEIEGKVKILKFFA
jgi:hypothetical protein